MFWRWTLPAALALSGIVVLVTLASVGMWQRGLEVGAGMIVLGMVICIVSVYRRFKREFTIL